MSKKLTIDDVFEYYAKHGYPAGYLLKKQDELHEAVMRKREKEEKGRIKNMPFDKKLNKWNLCSDTMPDDLQSVIVTWINHNPVVYYNHIKDVPNTDVAVRYKGKWYWWSAYLIDVLSEYGENYGAEIIDKDIEIVAWMPLPKPYKEEE